MKICTLMVSAITLCALSACTTVNKKTELGSSEISAKIQSSHITVEPIEAPVKLVERTKSKLIGNVLISSILSSAVASSGHPNPQQFQNQLEIGRTFGRELNKALPTGVTIDSGRGVDLALADKLLQHFNGKQGDTSGNKNEVLIQVRTNLWELGYESMLTSGDYGLNYHFSIVVKERQGDETRVLKTVACQGSAEPKMPLEAWRADKYQEVDVAAHTIVASCFKLALAEMGID